MDPDDIKLFIENSGQSGQSDSQGADGDSSAQALSDAATALSKAAIALRPGGGNRILRKGSSVTPSISSLGEESKSRIHAALRKTLAAELSRDGATLGLNPGDEVAISSSVGQSISF